jgi:hypothetical protein
MLWVVNEFSAKEKLEIVIGAAPPRLGVAENRSSYLNCPANKKSDASRVFYLANKLLWPIFYFIKQCPARISPYRARGHSLISDSTDRRASGSEMSQARSANG